MTLLPLSAGAAVPGGEGLIAYSDGTGIVVAKSDGSSSQRVAATGWNPSWNGEGTKIAYEDGAVIKVLTVPNPPAPGGATVTLSGTGTDPAFSPDGTKIAYVDAGEIKVRASDGTGSITNLSNSAAEDKDPAWSPDGTRIAFSRKPTTGTYSIWTMNADGTGQTQITSSGANDTRPTYSLTSGTVVFESDRDGTPATGHQIYSVSAGGGAQTRLTNSDPATENETAPAYSPSGRVLYSHAGTNPGIYAIGSTSPIVAGTNFTPDEQATLQAGSPTLSGSASQGSTLTVNANPDTWRPPYNVTFTYQWQRCDATNFCVNVGSGGTTYNLTGVDVGYKLKVIVTGSNGWSFGPNAVSATAGPTATITGGPGPVNTALPTISLPTGFDAPQIGFLVSATTGTWVGRTPITFKYQWTKCEDTTKNCYDIAGATSSFFTPTSDLANWDLSVTIYATNDVGTTYVRAVPTKPITGPPPVNHGSPVIIGQNYVKQTLTTTSGIWQGLFPITYTYQWKRCDAFGTLTSCVDIPGATSTTYVLQPADVDKTIRSFVTATNPIKSATQFSNHTFPTLPERHFPPSSGGLPVITGLAKPGVLLRATTGTWSGDTPFTFTYQWERCDATGATCRALPKATKNRYVVSSGDLGSTIRVKLTATNAYGTATVESAPSDAVTRSPKRPKGRRIVGTARADYLPGSGGDDTILGRGGNDTLVGGAGNDMLDGGPGNDVIDGGPGADKLFGGDGSDTILAADGTKDVIDCGEGNDKAVVDAIDVVKNCEAVTIATPSTKPPTPVSP